MATESVARVAKTLKVAVIVVARDSGSSKFGGEPSRFGAVGISDRGMPASNAEDIVGALLQLCYLSRLCEILETGWEPCFR